MRLLGHLVLGVFSLLSLFRLCSLLASVGRSLCGWSCWLLPGGSLLLSCVGWLLRFVAFVVGRVFFSVSSRPALGRWRFSLWRWFCVPVSSLASLRASCPVCAVRPAVVVRFGRSRGLVLLVWVLACPLYSDEEEETMSPCGGGGGGFAAAPAFA